MSKALGAPLRTGFEISTSRAEGAILLLIESARTDIEQVLASRRKLPSLAAPTARLKGRGGVGVRG